MKKAIVSTALASFFSITLATAQKILQSQVPAVIVNHFLQTFPKASDIEWEIKGEWYKVEFETGLAARDHDVWYEKTGKQVKHREEITAKELPAKVLSRISSEFGSYRISDVERTTENGQATYKVELKKFSSEWEVVFSAEGVVLDQKAD